MRNQDPKTWNLDDCIEDCHYISRFCEEKDEETMVCLGGWRSCADDCSTRFST